MSCVCINNNNNIVHVFIPFVYSLVSCILLEIFFNNNENNNNNNNVQGLCCQELDLHWSSLVDSILLPLLFLVYIIL